MEMSSQFAFSGLPTLGMDSSLKGVCPLIGQSLARTVGNLVDETDLRDAGERLEEYAKRRKQGRAAPPRRVK
jgi:hypothetical protein